ncbi:MAG: hypothetical protein J0H74_18130 [Chitinophagaceae bacterium]|nr:hypothetical protein [Chitinophagaceae bacterium]
MSEYFGQTSGTSVLQEELLKALIGKVVDLGTMVKENADQTRRIGEHLEVVKGLNELMTSQEKRVEELIQKEQEAVDEIKRLAGKVDLPVEKIEGLQQRLDDHSRLFEKPLDKTVRYHHYVGRVVWVLAVMIVVTAGAVGMMVHQWKRAGEYAGDVVKWRYVKLSVDTVVTQVVQRAEQSGLFNPGQFARDVEQEEHRRAELTKNMIQEQTARQKIDELQGQKGLR